MTVYVRTSDGRTFEADVFDSVAAVIERLRSGTPWVDFYGPLFSEDAGRRTLRADFVVEVWQS